MRNQKWINEGGIFFPVSGEIELHVSPGPGIWQVTDSNRPMDSRLGLRKISDKFEFNYKLYPLGGEDIINRVESLWFNPDFIATDKNLGIIFNGFKGTGKTVAAKLLCNQLDLPVIVVGDDFEGKLAQFIPSIGFECIVFIDEAEKIFNEDNRDLLALIDGVYSQARKLFVLTTNHLYINENLLGRPGRIRYIQEFRNLPVAAVKQYCEDNLKNKALTQEVIDIVDSLEISTIDTLKAIVEEVNIFGSISTTAEIMNLPRRSFTFPSLIMGNLKEESIDKAEELLGLILETKGVTSIEDAFMNPLALKDMPERLKKLVESNSGAARRIMNEIDPETQEPVMTISASDVLRGVLGSNRNYTTTIENYTPTFYIGQKLPKERGSVLSVIDEKGYIIVDDEGEEILMKILGEPGKPSLYRGGLVF